MATVQWRPEVNALTTPQSYRPRYIPHNVVGYQELAARIVQKQPTCNKELVESIMASMMEEIQEELINGNQVTLTNAFTFRLSLNGRLNSPDDPLPAIEDVLKVRVSASRPFVEKVQKSVQLERLPMTEKLPQINAAEDTILGLNDVINSAGALRLTGTDLYFTQDDVGDGCMLEGTRSGKTIQTRYVHISKSEIILLPDIVSQGSPWNNEYVLSLTTRYTENGTPRTGIYRRRLRTPITVNGFSQPNMEVGVLSGKDDKPYVTIIGGNATAAETLRIQAVLDIHEGFLFLNLQDLHDNGKQGEAVRITKNGLVVIPGFAGSSIELIDVTVNNFNALVQMIRRNYSGRLADVLKVEIER